jgi:hypothetical protein
MPLNGMVMKKIKIFFILLLTSTKNHTILYSSER